ncbi:DUF406 family protein [Vibrio sagamiensis]|uniref:DUF406 family protein n=1 Tax=Vibrio sagamiensis NBRC 104589 TaxID=1219064 RepID=A0A511QES3_9VIBR|nr:DUF406 family protein [Vibrio sagamiensis]PNQ60901.1 DUF406 domain-containing protein [Vibrio agarivorans]GEM75803.1 hypothetical protein VSA01S_19150 [Vibrio sagamiensis NBRC 104589]
MSKELEDNQVCDACGCAGEIGYIIKEGDDVATVTIFADTPSCLEIEIMKYIEVAKTICPDVKYHLSEVTSESKTLTGQFKFDVSAEKLIFELKTRSLAR